MLIPKFRQFSTHLDVFGKLHHNAYIEVAGLDHVCVSMDTDGQAQSSSIYVPDLKMFFETRS